MNSKASVVEAEDSPGHGGVVSSKNRMVAHASHTDVPRAAATSPPEATDVKALLEQLTFFLAPTSLVTALFYWIGWSQTKAYWAQFAVDPALLHYSTTDYLLRAMIPAFPFVTMLLVSAVVLVVIHRLLVRMRTRVQPFSLQVLEWAIRLLGLFCSAVALADVFPRQLSQLDLAKLASRGPLIGPTFGAVGGLFVAYASNLRAHTFAAVHHIEPAESRRLRRLLTGLAVGLVILATFLCADRYTSYLGTEWGKYDANHPKRFARVEVYSHQRLAITAKGVQETVSPEGAAHFQFHYSGLRLLRYSGKNYFILPDGERRTVLLPESDEFRVEFFPN